MKGRSRNGWRKTGFKKLILDPLSKYRQDIKEREYWVQAALLVSAKLVVRAPFVNGRA